MEIKFCPQCGTARQGAFCGGCGLSFVSFSTATNSNVAPNDEPLLDEANNVDDASSQSFPVPFGMKYGESFDQTRDCWNCGTQSETAECELCGGFSRD